MSTVLRRVAPSPRLSARCRDIVAAYDTGTMRYDIYLNDRTQAVVEEYESEEALLDHGRNIGDELSNAVLGTAEVRGQILGDLSDDLLGRLRGGPVAHFGGPVA